MQTGKNPVWLLCKVSLCWVSSACFCRRKRTCFWSFTLVFDWQHVNSFTISLSLMLQIMGKKNRGYSVKLAAFFWCQELDRLTETLAFSMFWLFWLFWPRPSCFLQLGWTDSIEFHDVPLGLDRFQHRIESSQVISVHKKSVRIRQNPQIQSK